MPEQPVQARSQARRDALLQATVEVAAERGLSGVTHRAVTDKAGLPLATASYFFDSITALADEAVRVFAARDAEALLALAAALSEQDSSPDEVATAFAAAVAPRWPDTAALIEAYLAAARTPALRDSVEASLEAARGVATAAATAAQVPAADAIAAALVALTQGFALHGLALPGRADADATRRAIRTLIIGHLVEQGETEAAVRLAGRTPPA